MRKFTLAGVAAAALVAFSGAAFAQAKSITIATEGAYAPWNFSEAGGKLAGYEIDLAADLCKRMKVECKVIAVDWDGIIPGVNAGKYDAIMAGMTITEKRRESIEFSIPYGSTPNGFVVSKSGPLAKLAGTGSSYSLVKDEAEALKVIEDMKALLKGKSVGVQVSTTNAAFIDKYFKGVADIKEYKTTEQHDLDLASGRLDATFAAMSYQNDVVKKPENKDFMTAGAAFSDGVLGVGVGVGLRKSDTALKAAFDEAIKGALADGTIKTMSTKWFGFDITPK
jgi:octopine/nopaline transport system substrate-binding protein